MRLGFNHPVTLEMRYQTCLGTLDNSEDVTHESADRRQGMDLGKGLFEEESKETLDSKISQCKH